MNERLVKSLLHGQARLNALVAAIPQKEIDAAGPVKVIIDGRMELVKIETQQEARFLAKGIN